MRLSLAVSTPPSAGRIPAAPAPDPARRSTGGAPPPAREASPRTPLRPEIQALRALAVALVVVYHAWPGALPGGFIGVDVFFVISGFLITGVLVREVDRRGTVSLAGFWARRARRLLPASLLVLAACVVGTVSLVPVTDWSAFLSGISASALYVQNWHLASTAVDYFAAKGPTPAQHFWSLSVEEQFYLAWPLLVLAATAFGRGSRRALAAVLGVTTLLSLACAVWLTATHPELAYFATPARAFEFGLGGLLALVAAGRRPRRAAALTWLGLLAILASAFLITDATPFPGWVALIPVLGTVAVIHAGLPGRALGLGRLVRARPVQGLGHISYAVYLWHWPLLVLVPFAVGRLDDAGRAAVIAATLVLAWATTRWVEDPVRHAVALARRPWRTLALAGLGTLAVVGGAAAATAHVEARVDRDDERLARFLADPPRCFGAASRDPLAPCVNPALATLVVPTPLQAPELPNAPCEMEVRRSRLRVCAFGVPREQARTTVALIGDSHASALRPAFDRVARDRGWRALSITRTGCPLSQAVLDTREPARSNCVQWNAEVTAWLREHPEVTTVFAASRVGTRVVHDAAEEDGFTARRRGFLEAWRALPPSVTRVVAIRDTPNMRDGTQACVSGAMGTGRDPGLACAVPRREALGGDAQVAAVELDRSGRLASVDLTDQLCDGLRCFPVVGGALVFRDEDHLNAVFAATLAPMLGRQADRAMTG